MANLAVYYDNKMNLLAFKDLDKIEASLFFSIVARFNDKGDEILTLSFSEISEYLGANYTNQQIGKIINSGVAKIVQTAIKWQMEPKKIAYFTLFNKFVVDETNYTLTANINDLFLELLNNFKDGTFTALELAEFSTLKSKYTQTLYRTYPSVRYPGYRYSIQCPFLSGRKRKYHFSRGKHSIGNEPSHLSNRAGTASLSARTGSQNKRGRPGACYCLAVRCFFLQRRTVGEHHERIKPLV